VAEGIVSVNDTEFDDVVVNSDVPVVVDFWAPWCGPCKAIAPVLEELAQEYDGKVKVAKVNVDDNPSAASRFGVRGIPTLIAFKGGEAADQVVGAVGKPKLQAMFERMAG